MTKIGRGGTPEEIGELKEALKGKISKKEYIRIHSVLLRKQGYGRPDIAQTHQVSFASVEAWITAYNQKGIKGLLTKKRQIPPKYILLRGQKDHIRQILRQHPKPSDTGVKVAKDQDFWSIATLRKLVKQLYGVEYTTSESYRRLFVHAGYSYQRVEFVDRRRDQQRVKHFKKRFQTKLKKGGISMWW